MISLEPLTDGSPAARNFDTLRRLVPDSGGQSVRFRFGTVTLTWPGASQQSNAPTTAHGLGSVPANAQLTPLGGLSAGSFVIAVPVVVAAGTDATNLQVTAKTHDESSPAAGTTAVIYWVVFG